MYVEKRVRKKQTLSVRRAFRKSHVNAIAPAQRHIKAFLFPFEHLFFIFYRFRLYLFVLRGILCAFVLFLLCSRILCAVAHSTFYIFSIQFNAKHRTLFFFRSYQKVEGTRM